MNRRVCQTGCNCEKCSERRAYQRQQMRNIRRRRTLDRGSKPVVIMLDIAAYHRAVQQRSGMSA